MTMMKKSLENTTKSIEQIMGTHKWNKGSEESLDRESIELNTWIEEWGLKIQHHDLLSKSQPKDLWDFKRISDIELSSNCKSWVDGI